MEKICETNFEFCNDDQAACYCSTDPMWIRKILKLAEKHPEDVRIAEYRKGESICVNLPKSWFKVSPPRRKTTRVMTDEQKAVAAERMRKIAEARREARAREKEQKQRLAEMIYDE